MARTPRMAQIEALLAEDPDDAFLRYGLAMEHAGAGDDAACVEVLRDLIARTAADPYVPAFLQAGQALVPLDRIPEACDVLCRGVHADEVIFRKAYGSRAVKPEKVPMTADTIFDMASLTKPVATATSVMILIEQGKLKPDDLVSKHWPAFAANGKDKVTVEQLLLH